MEMHQIRYFLTVAQTLNFTRAAEQCNVAQPSLTRAIKKLEQELGGDLFHREGRRTHLTDLGQMMEPMLTQSLESAVAAKEQAESYGKAEIANLRLGLSSTVEIRLLESALVEMVRVLPELKLQISRGLAEQVEQDLEDGRIDVAITASKEIEWARIHQWQLCSEVFDIAMGSGHHLSDKPVLKLGDLEDQQIVNRVHCEGAEGFSNLLESRNINATFTHEVSNESDLEFLLSRNLGIGLVPQSIKFGNKDIIRLPLDDAENLRSLFLLAVSGRKYSKPVDLFIKLIRSKDW